MILRTVLKNAMAGNQFRHSKLIHKKPLHRLGCKGFLGVKKRPAGWQDVWWRRVDSNHRSYRNRFTVCQRKAVPAGMQYLHMYVLGCTHAIPKNVLCLLLQVYYITGDFTCQREKSKRLQFWPGFGQKGQGGQAAIQPVHPAGSV